MNNNYYRWLYSDCGCGCNNGYKKIEDCDCDNILLQLSNIHTDINVVSGEVDNKQDILSAGTGIEITEENIINCTVSGSTDLSDYYTKEEVDALIPTVPSLSGYATEQWVTNQGYITDVDLSDYALKSEIPVVPTNVSAFNNDAGYLTDVDLSDYALKSEIPVVPTSNSAFTNDMHYLTSADTANYITSAATQTMINNAFYCCSEAEWQQISGNPQNNVLYLIY